jgi:hypothetical protein
MILSNNLPQLSKFDAYRGAIIATLKSPSFTENTGITPTLDHIHYCEHILSIMDDLELKRVVKDRLKEIKIPFAKRLYFIDPTISMVELIKSQPQYLFDLLQWLAYHFSYGCGTVLSQEKGKQFDMY